MVMGMMLDDQFDEAIHADVNVFEPTDVGWHVWRGVHGAGRYPTLADQPFAPASREGRGWHEDFINWQTTPRWNPAYAAEVARIEALIADRDAGQVEPSDLVRGYWATMTDVWDGQLEELRRSERAKTMTPAELAWAMDDLRDANWQFGRALSKVFGQLGKAVAELLAAFDRVTINMPRQHGRSAVLDEWARLAGVKVITTKPLRLPPPRKQPQRRRT